eukprot:736880-Pleurochrysis_carterae.AAC.1
MSLPGGARPPLRGARPPLRGARSPLRGLVPGSRLRLGLCPAATTQRQIWLQKTILVARQIQANVNTLAPILSALVGELALLVHAAAI